MAYVLPAAGRVTFFLCRFRTGTAIPVSLPGDATEAEAAALRAALQAWERAGLGVRFVELAAGAPASIAFSFASAGHWDEPGNTGLTFADCRVDPATAALDGEAAAVDGEIAAVDGEIAAVDGEIAAVDGEAAAVDGEAAAVDGEAAAVDGEAAAVTRATAAAVAALDAEIVYARIRLARRTPRDWRGRDRPLAAAELAGAAAHELGHALGLPGHVARSGSVMVRNREQVARIGASLLAGEPLREPVLRALYAAPSGHVVRRVPVSPVRTELTDTLAARARALGLRGPYVRTGDTSARIFYVPGPGQEAGFAVPDLAALRRAPERLALLPDARANALLDGAP